MSVETSIERQAERKPLRVDTPFIEAKTGRVSRGISRDVSESGIFVEQREPAEVGSTLDLFIGGIGVGAQVLVRVVRVVPGEGFGAKFTGDASVVRRFLR